MHWIIRVPRWSLSATRQIFPALIVIGNMHTSYSEDNNEYLFILLLLESNFLFAPYSLLHYPYIVIWYVYVIWYVQGYTTCCILASGIQENEEIMRKWRGNGERITLHIYSFSLYFLPLYQFPISKLLSQNVKYGTFVANVTKNLAYALWENNSGSNLRRGSSSSCAGLDMYVYPYLYIGRDKEVKVTSKAYPPYMTRQTEPLPLPLLLTRASVVARG